MRKYTARMRPRFVCLALALAALVSAPAPTVAQTADVAPASTPSLQPQVDGEDTNCYGFFQARVHRSHLEQAMLILNDQTEDAELRRSAAEGIAARMAECNFSSGHYAGAISYYRKVTVKYFDTAKVYDVEGLQDANADGEIPGDIFLWHAALAFERVNDSADAAAAIRQAHELTEDTSDWKVSQGSRDPRIIADYQRLDHDEIVRQQQEQKKKQAELARAKARAQARERAEAARQARLEAAAESAFLAILPPDERRVRKNRGEPCHTSSSNSSLGVFEIWYYDCISPGGIGRESYTFHNGHLEDYSRF
jgi:hypothetical protein